MGSGSVAAPSPSQGPCLSLELSEGEKTAALCCPPHTHVHTRAHQLPAAAFYGGFRQSMVRRLVVFSLVSV